MTRAKDISKIITDADFSGTLDVTGTVTAGGLTVASALAPDRVPVHPGHHQHSTVQPVLGHSWNQPRFVKTELVLSSLLTIAN